VPGRGGCQRIEIGQGGDVGRFVEHDEERWVEWTAGPGDLVVDVLDDLAHDRDEERRQPALIVGRGTEIQGVLPPDQLRGVGPRVIGGAVGTRRGSGKGLEDGLDRGVDRAPLALLFAEGRAGGVNGLGHTG
jgi:hypothetical protein